LSFRLSFHCKYAKTTKSVECTFTRLLFPEFVPEVSLRDDAVAACRCGPNQSASA